MRRRNRTLNPRVSEEVREESGGQLTTCIGRTRVSPLALEGTMTILCCWCLLAEVSLEAEESQLRAREEKLDREAHLLPMTRWTAFLGSPAPEIHHLCPLMTISLPSLRIEVLMLVALFRSKLVSSRSRREETRELTRKKQHPSRSWRRRSESCRRGGA